LDEQTCEDEPFDLETPITENLTLIQASFNDQAPCIQLDYIVLNGRPVAGTTLSVDIFPLGANVTISWYTSVNNRTYREIPGETESTFTVRPEDSGKFIRVYVVSDSNPPVVRYDTIKLDVFGTLSNGGGGGTTPPPNPPTTQVQALIDQGFIPISNRSDLEAVKSTAIHNFAGVMITEGGLSKKYVLINNVDLQGSNWIPIGTTQNPFNGTLNGNGYTINNLTINQTGFSAPPSGLFGFALNPKIYNLTLSNVNVNGESDTASLIGSLRITGSSVIENISIENGTVTGLTYVAGVIGKLDNRINTTISGITNHANVVTTNQRNGGVFGGVFGDSSNKTLFLVNIQNYGQVSNITTDLGTTYQGGLIGQAFSSISLNISKGANYGDIIGNSDIGGLIGRSESPIIMDQVSNYGDIISTPPHEVSGSYYFGGLIGFSLGLTTIRNSLNIGLIKVHATGNVRIEAGGFVGDIVGSNSTIFSSYSVTTFDIIANNSYVGYLVGNLRPSVEIFNDVYFIDTANSTYGAVGLNNSTNSAVTKTSLELIDITEFSNWNIASQTNTSTWAIGFNGLTTYPWLSWQNEPQPFQIIMPYISMGYIPVVSIDDLLAIESATSHTFGSNTEYELVTNGGLNNKYILINDIDLTSGSGFEASVINGLFEGTFNGNGHTLSNLIINASSVNNIGLFKQINGATISHVNLSGFAISGQNKVGNLVGEVSGGNNEISHVHVVNATLSGVADVGGIVGRSNSSNLTLASITQYGSVVGSDERIGGIIGNSYTQSSGKSINITNTFNYGTIRGTSIVGGLIGNLSGTSNTLTINASSNFGNVQGNGYDVGGIIGNVNYSNTNHDVTFRNVANLGDVSTTSTDDSHKVGGLIGSNSGTFTIENAYNTGLVTTAATSPTHLGGIVDENGSNVTLTLTNHWHCVESHWVWKHLSECHSFKHHRTYHFIHVCGRGVGDRKIPYRYSHLVDGV